MFTHANASHYIAMASIHSHFSSPQNIYKELLTIFELVNTKFKREVCRLVTIKDHLFCCLLFLPTSLPASCEILSAVQVCRWTSKTLAFQQLRQDTVQSLEKTILLRWLLPQLAKKSFELTSYPKEQALKLPKAPKNYSVARSIELKIETMSQSLLADSFVTVMVVRKVNRDIVNFKPYLWKVLENFLQEKRDVECFCVVEVLPTDGIQCVRDILPFSTWNRQAIIHVYSAFQPNFRPITCLVLHILPKTCSSGKNISMLYTH